MTDLDPRQGERTSDTEVMVTERFKALFEHMQEGVSLHELVCDEAGRPVDYRILDVNRQFEQRMGLQRADIVGQLATTAFGEGSAPLPCRVQFRGTGWVATEV